MFSCVHNYVYARVPFVILLSVSLHRSSSRLVQGIFCMDVVSVNSMPLNTIQAIEFPRERNLFRSCCVLVALTYWRLYWHLHGSLMNSLNAGKQETVDGNSWYA